MAFKTRDKCTADEAVLYLQDYFATVDLVSDALSKFESLASGASTAETRSMFRARALEAERDLELLKNKRRAFLNGQAAIEPPSPQIVTEAENRARELGAIMAKESKAKAIFDLAAKGLDAFNKLSAA
jgi:hypothetical protein